MADTWIVNLRHYLNQDGTIGIKSGSGRRLAGHFAAIVQETSGDIEAEGRFPRVRCRRRPGRKPCVGKIESYIDPEDDAIVWRCPVCGDNGAIASFLFATPVLAQDVHVDGYYRGDGTYVRPHTRSAPDDSVSNNYGAYTEQPGTD